MTIGWNYAAEKKKFDAAQRRLLKEYREAGMSEEAIRSMYEFDLRVFNSDRAYARHNVPLMPDENDSENERFSYHPLYFTDDSASFDPCVNSRFRWIDSIENEELCKVIAGLSNEDLMTLTAVCIDEYSRRETANMLGISLDAMDRRFARFRVIFSDFRPSKAGDKNAES